MDLSFIWAFQGYSSDDQVDTYLQSQILERRSGKRSRRVVTGTTYSLLSFLKRYFLLFVCVYVCVCAHVGVHVCVHVCVHVHICMCVSVFMHVKGQAGVLSPFSFFWACSLGHEFISTHEFGCLNSRDILELLKVHMDISLISVFFSDFGWTVACFLRMLSI